MTPSSQDVFQLKVQNMIFIVPVKMPSLFAFVTSLDTGRCNRWYQAISYYCLSFSISNHSLSKILLASTTRGKMLI